MTLDQVPDPATYFTNLIGVSLEGQLSEVIVRVRKPRAYYIRTKPWHSTQREVNETDEFIDFTWTVYTNRELNSKIFELGHDASVVSPEALKLAIEGHNGLS